VLRLFSRIKIAAPIVLAQPKGHERIGRARRRACYALPGVTELPYEVHVLSGNRKLFSTRWWRVKNQNNAQRQRLRPIPSNCSIFYHPRFHCTLPLKGLSHEN
jgi:hypothetical protein